MLTDYQRFFKSIYKKNVGGILINLRLLIDFLIKKKTNVLKLYKKCLN